MPSAFCIAGDQYQVAHFVSRAALVHLRVRASDPVAVLVMRPEQLVLYREGRGRDCVGERRGTVVDEFFVIQPGQCAVVIESLGRGSGGVVQLAEILA